MKNIIISLLFLMPHLLFSQTDLKQEGLYYFQNQDYYNAVYFLEMAVDSDSTDSKLYNTKIPTKIKIVEKKIKILLANIYCKFFSFNFKFKYMFMKFFSKFNGCTKIVNKFCNSSIEKNISDFTEVPKKKATIISLT